VSVTGDLANRLARVFRHQRKWAKRTGVTCFRVYEKDIPDQPLIVDWYDGDAVVWTLDRTRNDTPAAEQAWLAAVDAAVATGLGLPPERIWRRERRRQQDRQGGEGQYQVLGRQGVVKEVVEGGLRFEVNLSDYLDTGLFLDHRPTRLRLRDEARGMDVLNLFCYTGAFTCHAAAGGATSTVSVDLSNTYLAWAGRNLERNGLAGPAHRLVRADVLGWIDAAAKAGPVFDRIICDPPTFSNSTAMASSWSVDRDHPWLLDRCLRLLRPGGVLYFSTNSRGFRLTWAGASCEDISAKSVPEDFRNRRIHQCWRITPS
jgi:23S rRNA (cytosine1962-C5)-methyltransferase